MLTQKQAEDLAKDICFYHTGGPKCWGDCENCAFDNFWRNFILSAKKVIKKYEETKK